MHARLPVCRLGAGESPSYVWMLSGNSELDIERSYNHIYSVVPIPVDPLAAIDSTPAMASGYAVLKLLDEHGIMVPEDNSSSLNVL